MSTSVPPTTEEPLVYRPLSGLAVAGFTVSALYGAIILVAGMRALSRGEPLLLPGLMLLWPIAGALLSYLGQVQIKNAEGTRAGLKLTRWGLGLALCFGLGYFVYGLGTGLAIRNQASQFLMEAGDETGFFPHLQKGARAKKGFLDKDMQAAFRLTLEPAHRQAAVRADRRADFLLHPLVQFFATGSEQEIKVEPRGVIEWSYSETGFTVRRLFHLSNEGAEADAVVTVKSLEGREGEPRQWFVSMKPEDTGLQKLEPRPAGTVADRLRLIAVRAVETDLGKGAGSPDALLQFSWDWRPEVEPAPVEEQLRALFAANWGKGADLLRGMGLQPESGKGNWAREDNKLKFFFPFKQKLEVAKGTQVLFLLGDFEVASVENVGPLASDLNLTWRLTAINYHFIQLPPDKSLPSPPKGK